MVRVRWKGGWGGVCSKSDFVVGGVFVCDLWLCLGCWFVLLLVFCLGFFFIFFCFWRVV